MAKAKDTAETQGAPAPWAKPQETTPEPPVNEGGAPVTEGSESLPPATEPEAPAAVEGQPPVTEAPSTTEPEAPVDTAPVAVDPEPEGPAEDRVTVTVPKAFKLRIDHQTEHNIKPGVQKMERSLAEHWYSKANGVAIFEG